MFGIAVIVMLFVFVIAEGGPLFDEWEDTFFAASGEMDEALDAAIRPYEDAFFGSIAKALGIDDGPS
jgi:hypothetical protein